MNNVQIIGANRPILLDEQDSLWLVREGSVDVFAVRLAPKGFGRRYHLFRVPVFSALFGITFPEDTPIKLLGVALNNTIVQKYASSIFFPSEGETQKFEKLALDHIYLFEDWLANLAKAIVTTPPLVTKFVKIAEGEGSVEANQSVYIDEEKNFWIKVQSGSLVLNDALQTTITSESGYFPALNQMVFTAKDPVVYKAVSSVTWVINFFKRADLNEFYKVVAANCLNRVEHIERNVLSEIQTQKKLDELFEHRSLLQIGSLLNPEEAATEVVFTTVDPLINSLQLIAKAQGFTLPAEIIAQIKDGAAGQSQNNIVNTIDIADKLSIRVRQVKLTDGWWKDDSGYMLGFRKDNDHPCVLTPLKKGGYTAYDVQKDSTVAITKESASEFLDDAFVVYKPSTEKQLKWRDYLKKGLFGSKDLIMHILIYGSIIAVLSGITPAINGIIFNNVIPESDFNLYTQAISILVAALLCSTVFNVVKAIALLRFKTKVGSVLQMLVWDRILRLPIVFFKQFNIGNLAFRTNMIGQQFYELIASIIGGAISVAVLIVSFFLLFYYNGVLALLGILFSFVSIIFYIFIFRFKLNFAEKIYGLSAKQDGLIRQLFTNIIKIRNNAAENRAFAKWTDIFAEQTQNVVKSQQMDILVSLFQSIIAPAANILIFWIIISYSETLISPGDLIAFFSAYALWSSALMTIAGVVAQGLTLKRIFKFMQPIFDAEAEGCEIKSWPAKLTGGIVINKLAFRYQPEAPLVLRDVSLQIRPGEFVAIVGTSGCGKSTLFRLMLGFEIPESGEILYDGFNISDIDIRALRHQFGVVLQNSALATATIYENISSGNPKITLDDAWEASRFAGLDKFINALPMKMHTLVMEGGGGFSGGQRQQIMIARAIARKTPILFFDEASSALDNSTQELVSQNLKKLPATRIVVAHRLSTIIHADQIYVIDAGKIVQRGNYAELIKEEQGLFARLAKRQLL